MRLLRLIALVFIATTPVALHAQREKLPPADFTYVEKNWPNAKATASGMRTEVLVSGTGEKPSAGDRVSVLYKGMLLNGTVFDQTRSADQPFTFRTGRGEVISGWEEGIPMMQAGEKRLLIIPFELGYGTRGDPPKIPRRATLVFEVELVKFEKPDPATQVVVPEIDPKAKKKDPGIVTNVPPMRN